MPSFKIILLYLGWGLLWAVVQTLVLYQFGFRGQPVVVDALLTNGLLLGSGYVMATSLKYYQPEPRQIAYLLGWSAALAAIMVWFCQMGVDGLLEGQVEYQAFVHQSYPVRVAFAWLMILFIVLQNWLWYYTKEKRQAEERKTATEKMAREAELFTLRQQLQPHFLFNSLNSISALVKTKPDQAKQMVQQLSDFLRGTLRKDGQTLIPLADELHHLQIYLEIEKVRFGHRLQTQVECPEICKHLQLPYLLLQPIVENAIKFGLYDTLGDTLIKITARCEDGQLIVSTENPFEASLLSPKQGTGFGLDSVRRRLYLLFGRQDLVSTQQHEGRFITTVKIPQSI
ncbi:histidine kinase [Rufibacter radiotolerans]|uniref:Histidine kinase n=1 Tax=Rufibacter radiotolerans TaxID=1379910 RepID=A0A0H4VV04_9BACT|nr:histidine kinase [Rufibacter radiotolerans]AKQ47762.1 histidine kinase [Rufibacter radiotolerans]